MGRKSEIKFIVQLDENSIPEGITWESEDTGGAENPQPTSSFFISLWDNESKNTLTMGLWTKQMMVPDMDVQYFQTLLEMAENYQKATGNAEVAGMMRNLAQEIGIKLDIIRFDEDPN